jgi:hypothetical protein
MQQKKLLTILTPVNGRLYTFAMATMFVLSGCCAENGTSFEMERENNPKPRTRSFSMDDNRVYTTPTSSYGLLDELRLSNDTTAIKKAPALGINGINSTKPSTRNLSMGGKRVIVPVTSPYDLLDELRLSNDTRR